MPKFLLKKWHGQHNLWTFVVMIALAIVLFFYQWIAGVFALLVCGVLIYYTLLAEKAFRHDFNRYMATISHRVKKASNDAITEMPLGIVLYNDDMVVDWHNPFIAKMFGEEHLIGRPVHEFFPDVSKVKEKDTQSHTVMSKDKKVFSLQIKPKERLLYVTDITEMTKIEQLYEEDKPSVGLILLDNMDEATQGMDDQTRSIMIGKVTNEITEWAQKYNILIKRMSSDRFLIIMNQKVLKQLEQSRFGILDDVRDITIENKLPFTLSIGIASGTNNYLELGHLAQTSLDIALGRGGDQAAVKSGQRLTFYGGRSNAVEKRTRVRARVISHAFRDLVKDSDKVIIMGHRYPDMDSIGAAVGVLKMVQMTQKEGYIVLEGTNPSIQKLMDMIVQDERLYRWFITPEQALQLINQRTLAVVVDTHKASMVAEPRLLQMTQRKFIVDHHRRGEEFINDATMVYIEPYASSTCELVTELLQYSYDRLSLEVIEATILLAGVVVDTKSFSLRTGARTFEAASFLRRHGADLVLIQRMMQEDLHAYIRKAEIIRNTVVLHRHVALAAADDDREYSQLTIAQVADTLLNMTGMVASFVICRRSDGLVSVSARSLGQINVQVIMEKLGGGGHLTNAAAQITGSVQEVVDQLKQILDELNTEEELL